MGVLIYRYGLSGVVRWRVLTFPIFPIDLEYVYGTFVYHQFLSCSLEEVTVELDVGLGLEEKSWLLLHRSLRVWLERIICFLSKASIRIVYKRINGSVIGKTV